LAKAGVVFERLEKNMNAILAWAPGGMEIVLILVAILVFFGSKKIPELPRLGPGHQGIQKGVARSDG